LIENFTILNGSVTGSIQSRVGNRIES
jgi:hypothetical protein